MKQNKFALGGSMHKKNPYKIFTFLIVGLFLLGLVYATTISSNKVSTGDIVATGDINMSADKSLRLYSDNRDLFNEGNSIELYALDDSSKSYVAWYDKNNAGTGWIGCHNLSETDLDNPEHSHCSWETNDTTTNTLQTRFEIKYGMPSSTIYASFVNLNKVLLKDGVSLHVNATTQNQTVKLERATNSLLSGLVFTRANVDRWFIGQRTGTDDFVIRSSVQGVNAINISAGASAQVRLHNLTGTGNAYVCVDANGQLYRSDTACVE
jgi:hypothetical protein